MRIAAAALFAWLAVAGAAHAVEFHFDGFADLRAVVPSNAGSYYYGDLGKLRFGYDDGDAALRLTDIVGEARLEVSPALEAVAVGRIGTSYGTALDLTEAFLRYRPVSTTPWRWSVKLGAFFPPVSLENDQIGWTSAWTITPSAINSWVGYELRTIGAEGTLEWRRAAGTISLAGALFGWNDPAGVLMADRGWSLDDRVSGLFEKERIPDAMSAVLHKTPPIRTELFDEIDGTPGWYLNLSADEAGIGTFNLMRYDNEADPTAVNSGGVRAWRTSFWDVGFRRTAGDVTLLAQAMAGSTEVRPSPSFRTATNFSAAYVLAGLDLDPWRLAARIDLFRTHTAASPQLSEDGAAGTLSATWWARDWLQLTGEFILADSTRTQRAILGDPVNALERQVQLLARIYF